jgi:hypothetical protein
MTSLLKMHSPPCARKRLTPHSFPPLHENHFLAYPCASRSRGACACRSRTAAFLQRSHGSPARQAGVHLGHGRRRRQRDRDVDMDHIRREITEAVDAVSRLEIEIRTEISNRRAEMARRAQEVTEKAKNLVPPGLEYEIQFQPPPMTAKQQFCGQVLVGLKERRG